MTVLRGGRCQRFALDDLNYPKSWESGWTPAEREALAAAAAKNGHANGTARKPAKAAKASKAKTVSARTTARGAKSAGGDAVNTWN